MNTMNRTAPLRGGAETGDLTLPSVRAANEPLQLNFVEVSANHLVEGLGSEDFPRRNEASSSLLRLAAEHPGAVLPILERAKSHDDPEVSGRAGRILEKLTGCTASIVCDNPEEPLGTVNNRYTKRSTFTLLVTPENLSASGLSISGKPTLTVRLRDSEGHPVADEAATFTEANVASVEKHPEGRGFLVRCEVRTRYNQHVESAELQTPVTVAGDTRAAPIILRSWVGGIRLGSQGLDPS